VCRALGVECALIAASGAVLEANSAFHTTVVDMWWRTLGMADRPWRFERFTPDVVYIHIGQNDVQK
jgi:hypothetical protein